jgi:hypothetical protein
MLKRVALIGTLALILAVPAAAATSNGDNLQTRLRSVSRLFHTRVRQSVRRGRIAPEQLNKLRADRQALADKARAFRQSGTPLTRAARQELRSGVRQLRNDLRSLRRNSRTGGGQ